MQVRELERLKKEERERAQKERADRFWACFLFTENGKVKSTLLLYSFCLCFVFLAVYGVAYALIVEWLDPLLAGHPVALVNFVEAAVPTLVGTAVCSLTWPISRDKRMMLAAYLWLALLAVASFIAMLILLWGNTQAQVLFLQVFLLFVPAPVILGCALSAIWYTRYRRRTAANGKTEA